MRSVNGTLILLNVIAFLLQLQSPDLLLVHYALWPLGAHAMPELGAVVEFEDQKALRFNLRAVIPIFDFGATYFAKSPASPT